MTKENEHNCLGDEGVYYAYFMKDGIERKGMYCKECKVLLDYIPQYNKEGK